MPYSFIILVHVYLLYVFFPNFRNNWDNRKYFGKIKASEKRQKKTTIITTNFKPPWDGKKLAFSGLQTREIVKWLSPNGSLDWWKRLTNWASCVIVKSPWLFSIHMEKCSNMLQMIWIRCCSSTQVNMYDFHILIYPGTSLEVDRGGLGPHYALKRNKTSQKFKIFCTFVPKGKP